MQGSLPPDKSLSVAGQRATAVRKSSRSCSSLLLSFVSYPVTLHFAQALCVTQASVAISNAGAGVCACARSCMLDTKTRLQFSAHY